MLTGSAFIRLDINTILRIRPAGIIKLAAVYGNIAGIRNRQIASSVMVQVAVRDRDMLTVLLLNPIIAQIDAVSPAL